MRKTLFFLMLILVSALLMSCADKEQEADEIITYYNEEWIPINNFKEDNIGEFTTEFIRLDAQEDKSEAIQLLESEIIPLVEEVITKLENVEPKNKKIKKMNNLQIETEQLALENFKDIIKYYDGDMTESKIAKGSEKVDSMYDDIIEYQNKIFKEYNLKKSDEKIGNFSKIEKDEKN